MPLCRSSPLPVESLDFALNLYNSSENEQSSELANDYRINDLLIEGNEANPNLVGDGGFEPPTSTMST